MNRWTKDGMLALVVTCLLFAMSLTVNVMQATRGRVLTKRVEVLSSYEPLAIGTVVPSVSAVDVRGEFRTAVPQHPRRPVVLYWMRPSCVWSQRNEDGFRALAAGARERFDVLAVSASLDGLQAFHQRGRGAFMSFGPISETARRAYRLNGTPTTIVVDERLRVVRVWVGAYTGGIAQEIEEYFGVELPTLR